MKKVTTKGAQIHFRKDGIIHIHYDDDLLTLDDVKNVFNITRQNSPWDVAPIYLTGGTFTNQEKDARKFNGSDEVMKHCSAIAFLSKTAGEKILANFFIKFMKPSKPSKFFNTEEEAITWLKGFVQANNN